MVCVARPGVARINRIPRFMLICGNGMKIKIHMDRVGVSAKVGAMIKRNTENVDG